MLSIVNRCLLNVISRKSAGERPHKECGDHHDEPTSCGRARSADGMRWRPRNEKFEISSPRGRSNKGIQIRDKQDCSRYFQRGAEQVCCPIHTIAKNVANYLQHMSAREGYLVAETVRSGREQIIELPPPLIQMPPTPMTRKSSGQKRLRR